jgi:hypothetical protein
VDRDEARHRVAATEWRQACAASADSRTDFQDRLQAIKVKQRRLVPVPAAQGARAGRRGRPARPVGTPVAADWDDHTLAALAQALEGGALEAALAGTGLVDGSDNQRGVRRRTDGTVERF